MSSVIEQLIRLAGPLGPLGTFEDQARLRDDLRSGAPPVAAQRVLDAVAAAPALPANVTPRDFEGAATEILAELADDPGARQVLERGLADPAIRPVAIDALGLSCNPLAGPALARLVLDDTTLREDELGRVVSALGCVGGDDAVAALGMLRARDLPESVVRELEIALEAIAPK
jgi:predicted naringenin-chalcone synthase